MRGPQRIGRKGLDRIRKGFRDQRLRRQVNDDGWPMPLDSAPDGCEVADIADGRNHTVGDVGLDEQVRVGRRGKRKSSDVTTNMLEPTDKPAAGKAGMAGDKDALPFQT